MSVQQGCAAAAAVLRVEAQTPLPPTEQDDFDKVVMTARAELDESSLHRSSGASAQP